MKQDSNFANLVASEMDKIIVSNDHKKLFHKIAKTEVKEKKNSEAIKVDTGDMATSLILLSSVFEGLGFEKSAASAIKSADCLISEAMEKAEQEEAALETNDARDTLLEELGLKSTTEKGEMKADLTSDRIALEIFEDNPDLEEAVYSELESHPGIAPTEKFPKTMLSKTMPSAEERHTLPYSFDEEAPETEKTTGKTLTPPKFDPDPIDYEGPGRAEFFTEMGDEFDPLTQPGSSELSEMSLEDFTKEIREANLELDSWIKKNGGTSPCASNNDSCSACSLDKDLTEDMEIEEQDSTLESLLSLKKPWEEDSLEEGPSTENFEDEE